MLQVFRTVIVTCQFYVIYLQFCKKEFVSELFPFSKASVTQVLLIPICNASSKTGCSSWVKFSGESNGSVWRGGGCISWDVVPAQDLELFFHCYLDYQSWEGKCCVYTAGWKQPVWLWRASRKSVWWNSSLSQQGSFYSWDSSLQLAWAKSPREHNQRKNWNVLMHPCVDNEAPHR